MASPSTKTDICNLALGRIGSAQTTVTLITTPGTDPTAIQCNLHYEQTRDALLRSHRWRFASARAELAAAADPDFEWDNAFNLPDDFLAMKAIYDDSEDDHDYRNHYVIEGKLLLTDEDECSIRYIKQVTTVADFDPLFIEVLVLQLALKLVMPLAQDLKLYAEIKDDLKLLMPKVRALDRQETNTTGRAGRLTWNESRY